MPKLCDLADALAVDRYIQAAGKTLGGIDVPVNNATGFQNTSDMWSDCLSVDLMAAVRASAAAQPFLVKSGDGAIVNISSISGLRSAARNPGYAVAKTTNGAGWDEPFERCRMIFLNETEKSSDWPLLALSGRCR